VPLTPRFPAFILQGVGDKSFLLETAVGQVVDISMSYFNIRLGSAGGEGAPGMLVVTRDRLIFKTTIPETRDYICLEDADVLAIGTKRFLLSQMVVVEYITFNKVKSVVFYPVDESIHELLLMISCIGFKPKANMPESATDEL
jgi:hypothetical protein